MAYLSVAEAQSHILDAAAPLATETVPLAEARGRVLAAGIDAPFSQPPFTASAMDGYAFRHGDTPPLRLVGTSRAGERFTGTMAPGETVRIFTGAPMPDGADSVVIQEDVERQGETIRFDRPLQKGANVRAEGCDFIAGGAIAAAGDIAHWRRLALIAATGLDRVEVYRRPRVAILASGDELVWPGARRGADQIYASSIPGLAAFVEDRAGVVIASRLLPDLIDEIRAAIRAASEDGADVICLVGGASVGDHDLTHAALTAEGAGIGFWKIAMRPGKPMMYGRLKGRHVVGLPGNPVSAMACALLYLGPLLARLGGVRDPLPPALSGVCGCDLPANDFRQDHLRAHLRHAADGTAIVTPDPVQDSSVQSAMARSTVLLLRPAHAPAARAGEPCTYFTL